MTDWRRYATQAARRAGIDPNVFIRQINQESGFNPTARSGAGAIGIAQIVPRWHPEVDPTNPAEALDWAAHYMASQVRHYGNWRDALSVYNSGRPYAEGKGIPETRNYVASILGGTGGGGPPTSPASSAGPTETPPDSAAPPTPSPTAGPPTLKLPSLDVFPEIAGDSFMRIAQGMKPTATLGFLSDAITQQMMQPTTQIPGKLSLPQRTADRRGHETTHAQRLPDPGGGWQGTYGPATSVAHLAERYGLTPTSEKRDTKMTASGNPSDHWVGSKNAYAYDLGGAVPKMDKAARVITQHLGIPYTGGELVANVVRNGLRYQVLYRTNTGGNHFDHIHVGVKRVG